MHAVGFLADNAYAGGLDYDWRLSQMYSISGYLAGSHIAGNTEAIQRLQENNVHTFQRPDADYLGVDPDATTLQGHAGSVSFGKISGESTRFSSFVGYKSPGFDTNDLGFMRRADEKNQSNWFQWRNFKPGKYVRTRNFNINQYSGWNFGGDRLYSGGNINSHWTFTNYYSIGGGFNARRGAVPRSRDARRSRRARQSDQARTSGITRTPTTARRCRSTTTAATGPTPRTARARTSIPASTGARPRRCRSISASVTASTTTIRSG